MAPPGMMPPPPGMMAPVSYKQINHAFSIPLNYKSNPNSFYSIHQLSQLTARYDAATRYGATRDDDNAPTRHDDATTTTTTK